MGSQMSGTILSNTSGHRPPSATPYENPPSQTTWKPGSSSNAQAANLSNADLSLSEAEYGGDPDLRAFCSIIQARTSRGINSIAAGLDFPSLSVESLSDVSERLLEMNQQFVKIILQNRKDIWGNKELCDLVDDYFENTLFVLDFCIVLGACLNRAGHIESIVNLAYEKFEEEHHTVSEEGSVKNYSKTLAELRNLIMAGDPFTHDFFKIFSSAYSQQALMLERLQLKKRKLDRKLRWRKLSAVRDLKGQREIIISMQMGIYIIISDLNNMRVLVEKLEFGIEPLLDNADFAMREVEAVVIVVELIIEKLDFFMDTTHVLSDLANKCIQDIRKGRTLVLRRLINYSV